MVAGVSNAIFVLCVFCLTVVDAKIASGNLNKVVDKLESLMIRLGKIVDKLKVVQARSTQLRGPALPATTIKPWSDLNMITLLGKKYHINHELRVNYDEAFEWCKSRGLQLVSIETEAENNALAETVLSQFDRDSFMWTSGRGFNNIYSFAWKSTGEPLTFTNWFYDDPTNFGKDEHCVLVGRWTNGGQFGWMDVPCLQWRHKLVCEEP